MITVEVINWKALKDQFGVEPKEDLRSAKEIYKALQKEVFNLLDKEPAERGEPGLQWIGVSCTKKGEAVACFSFVSKNGEMYVYEYNGTAN